MFRCIMGQGYACLGTFSKQQAVIDGNGHSLEENLMVILRLPEQVVFRYPLKRRSIESIESHDWCSVSARGTFKAFMGFGRADALGSDDACIMQDGH